MKSILKFIYYIFIDKYAFDKNIPIYLRFYLSFKHRLTRVGIYLSSNERRFQKIKDIHKGERCFLIGNGPSLNQMDLTKLKNEITFGVNAIYLNYDKMKFHPTYYAVEDVFVAEDRADEINAYLHPKLKFYGNYLRRTLKKDKNTIFINLLRNYADEKTFPYFSKNCVRSLGVGGSVTYVCLELAYHMGFKEVYMIGFDHNYKIPDSVVITNKRKTGFDILSTEDDVNHFSKDYFGKGYRWHDPLVDRMEVGFAKANEEFLKDNRQIFNATVGGKLEILTRVDYNSLFS